MTFADDGAVTHLESLTLHAIGLLTGAGQAYGYAIVERLRQAIGRPMSNPQVYTLLHRLEHKGLVTREVMRSEKTGRLTYQYRVTAAGIVASGRIRGLDTDTEGGE